ncbi:MAG: two-component sensor histidine kinase [Clostridia bacterium]|nr:two-component sensor histidine kinase [Clostridia bacterium]
MKHLSIMVKLFIISAAFFIVFMAVALFGQSSFFEKFYTNQKIETLDEAIEGFNNLYASSDWLASDIIKHTKIFEQYNDVQLGIINSNFDLINKESFEVVIKERSGNIVKIRLNSLIETRDYYNPNLRYGDYVTAEGVKWRAPFENFTPEEIAVNDIHWIGLDENIKREGLEKIEGKVIGFNLPKQEDLIRGVDNQNLVGAINQWLSDNEYGEVGNYETSYIYTDTQTREKNIVLVKPILGTDAVAFVVASQQPVLESLQVLRSYYFYVILGAILVSLLMSYIFSILITQPLIQVNEKAKAMANLDFDDYIEVTSYDEIGSLSVSLNTLSYNLKTSLTELQEANIKLVEDIERERRIEMMRKEFISGISHELKTPLGIIKGFAEGIKDGIAKEKTDVYIDVILDEVDKMNALVLDMLDLSRLQLASYRLVLSTFDIVDMAYDVKERFTNQLAEKELQVHVTSNEDVVVVEGDYRRIEQVLVNYVSNAIRHSYRGETIEVNLERKQERVMIRVKNVGEHIPKEKLNKIWNRFYRVEESRAKTDGGTGLGLAITKNILELHGSYFGVENTDNGVVFFFDLEVSNEECH